MGLDANRDGMRKASARAAAKRPVPGRSRPGSPPDTTSGSQASPPSLKSGSQASPPSLKFGSQASPNVLFVWAAVEQLPPELTGVTELHVIMPWGSLLRALLAPDPAVLAGLTAACRPGARFQIAVNLHAWRQPVPELAGIPEPDPDSARHRLADAYRAAGARLERAAYLTDSEIDALHSSWTRRLRSSHGGRPDRYRSAGPPSGRERRRRFEVLELSGTIAGPQSRTGPDTSSGADGVS